MEEYCTSLSQTNAQSVQIVLVYELGIEVFPSTWSTYVRPEYLKNIWVGLWCI